MPLAVIQAGDTLRLVSDDGVMSNALTLPTGVVLRTDVPPRFYVFDNYAFLVNTPSQPLIINAKGTVRLLCPKPPRLAPTLAAAASGGLTGTYNGARYTFVTKDDEGNTISESDYSPASNSVTISAKLLRASGLDISPDEISGRRIYRPSNGGATLFQWVDLDGNVLTAVDDDLSDAGLSLIASPILGTPPHLTHIAEFRGRMWGVSSEERDNLRYTEAGLRYSWPEDNIIKIPVIGSDSRGITGLIHRREALGCGKVNQFVSVTGTGQEDSDGVPDFDTVVNTSLGIESQETACTHRDIGYFLWKDGLYTWGSDGIQCVSDGSADGKGNVRSWFTTDSYFDRDSFSNSFGGIDPIRNKYRLFLLGADEVTWYWVEFDIKDRTWWGPHKTDLFTPKCTFITQNASNTELSLIGSTGGDLYKEQTTRTDGTATAIAFDVTGKRHDMGEPDMDKFFGMISMLGKAQTAGTVAVLSTTGELNATLTKTQYYNMQRNRHSLGRLGTGKHVQIRFTHSTVGQEVELYGYEVDDVHLTGRR